MFTYPNKGYQSHLCMVLKSNKLILQILKIILIFETSSIQPTTPVFPSSS